MAKRFHLDSVTTRDDTIWFTLVIEDPTNYFVEQYHDSKIPFATKETKHISRSEFGRHWVNGVPLIVLIENKLGDLAEAEYIKSLKDFLKELKQNPNQPAAPESSPLA